MSRNRIATRDWICRPDAIKTLISRPYICRNSLGNTLKLYLLNRDLLSNFKQMYQPSDSRAKTYAGRSAAAGPMWDRQSEGLTDALRYGRYEIKDY